jgi:secondary thiamine-phosphate synthase enzyme
MQVTSSKLTFATPGRCTLNITAEVQQLVQESNIRTGVATLFVRHTSASLLICENADPQVRRDLEAWLQRACPDGDPLFGHVDEGPDDMPAHVRSTLTATSLTIPIANGGLDLGTWQGIYLYEHRIASQCRTVSVTLMGEV